MNSSCLPAKMEKFALNAASKAIRCGSHRATICELYGKAKATISGHIKNIFDEGELVENSVVRFYRTTASDGAGIFTRLANQTRSVPEI